jgi:hypothetical protein
MLLSGGNSEIELSLALNNSKESREMPNGYLRLQRRKFVIFAENKEKSR